jgi:hypothetical protein
MEFKEGIIVRCEVVNRNKIFVRARNMKYIVKMNIMMRDFLDCMTNITSLHTCSICGVT